MSCKPPIRTITTARRVLCFSEGGSAPGESEIHVLTSEEIEQIAPLLAGVRVTITVENATEVCQTKTVLQATSDGCTWGDSVDLESYTAGNRVTTTAWHTTATSFLRGIRIGVLVGQTSGTAIQMCKVTLVIDFELRS
jgi:hypothetical protein